MLYFLVSFLACTVGAICGIGGGVIIKPVLDLVSSASVSTISFLSGTSVLAMSCYSVARARFPKGEKTDTAQTKPLAVGAAVGGLLGKELFSTLLQVLPFPEIVGAVQSAFLAIVTALTLLYTLKKSMISTVVIRKKPRSLLIGLALGVMSSFLGIGGGPINLMVLSFLYSMDSKTAAANSLYIILFSQTANLLATIVTSSVPLFSWVELLLMVAGGIGGGVLGRAVNQRVSNNMVDRLFICLMTAIIGISIFNTVEYLSVI